MHDIIQLALFIASFVATYYFFGKVIKLSGWKKHSIAIFTGLVIGSLLLQATETPEQTEQREERQAQAKAEREHEKAEREQAKAERKQAKAERKQEKAQTKANAKAEKESHKKLETLLGNFILNDVIVAITAEKKDSNYKIEHALEIVRISVSTHASELSGLYNNNEIAADAKYKNRNLLVSGRANSIGKDIIGTPYVALYAFPYTDVKAQFKSSELNELAALSVGQKVDIVCRVDSFMLTMVMLDRCSMLNNYLRSNGIKESVGQYAQKILSGKTTLTLEDEAFIRLAYIVNKYTTNESPCVQTVNDACRNQTSEILKRSSNNDTVEASAFVNRIKGVPAPIEVSAPHTSASTDEDEEITCEEGIASGNMFVMLECASDEAKRQDDRLNAAYKVAMSKVADKTSLRNAQRAWIKERDKECEIDDDDDGGKLAGLIYTQCLAQKTAKRADELEAIR